VVDALVECPPASDTRDTEAVKRLATAFLKLLFPNIGAPNEITAGDFNEYCLKPARNMRGIIKYQLGLLDEEYKDKPVPVFCVNEARGG
jgi:ATP-dependent Lon protease